VRPGVVLLPTDVRLPTVLDALKERYIKGEIDIIEFEKRAETLLANGWEDLPDWPLGGSAPAQPFYRDALHQYGATVAL
jgi:hypothetical protein